MHAPAFNPGGIACAKPLRRHDVVFRCLNDVDSRSESFRGSITRPAHSLRAPCFAWSASQPGSPLHHARLASSNWLDLSG